MGNLLKCGIGLLIGAVSLGFIACSEDTTTNENTVKLVPNKSYILPDGSDKVTFTVLHGDENVTASAEIFDAASDTKLDSNTFTSTSEGTYSFYAVYGGEKSAAVTITVTVQASQNLILQADKLEVKANGQDAVTFKVLYQGADITENAKIFNTTLDTALEGHIFYTENNELEEQVFYAEYNSEKSESVTIEIKPGGLWITTSAENFFFDGEDQIAVKVMYNGDDVTSEAYLRRNGSMDEISNNFVTTKNEPVTFIATYEDKHAELTVNPYTLAHKVLYIKFSGTDCLPCYTLSKAIDGALPEIEDIITQVAIHGYKNDPFIPSNLNGLVAAYGSKLSGYPHSNFDFKEEQTGVMTANTFSRKIITYAEKDSSVTLRAKTTLTGNTLTAEVDVWCFGDGNEEYFMGAMLCEDGLIHYQAGYGNNYTHNHTYRESQFGYFGEENSLGMLSTGDIERNITVSFDVSDYVAENCNIVLFLTKKSSEKYVVVNSLACHPGATTNWAVR